VSNTDLEQKIKTILIAARTYAYYYIDKSHRKYGTSLYDGSDDPDTFQKYLGYGYEMRSPRVTRFAEDTHGQVITYLGEVVKTWYFSASDGRTLSYSEYCSKNTGKTCQDIPYLQSVADPGSV
jgi:SpoIID/LytB domain protein